MPLLLSWLVLPSKSTPIIRPDIEYRPISEDFVNRLEFSRLGWFLLLLIFISLLFIFRTCLWKNGVCWQPKMVVVKKGVKHSQSIASVTNSQITVLACSNADGLFCHCLWFLMERFLNQNLYSRRSTRDFLWSFKIRLDRFGFIWALVRSSFLAFAPAVCPLLLLIDGHSSHYNPQVFKKAAEEGVSMFVLQTHLTQPLDKGPFGPLKNSWKDICRDYLDSRVSIIIITHLLTFFHSSG